MGIINRVIAASRETESTVAPLFGDRSGNPICLPWVYTQRIMELEEDQDINQLLMSGPAEMFSLPAALRPQDIDTPEDYRRLSVGSNAP